MGKWEMVRWEQVLQIKNGKNQKAVESSSGVYPIYGSGGIMGYANDYICPEKTTIIGRKGSINSPIYAEQKFWNVDTAFGLVANPNLDSKFLYYFCVQYNFLQHNKAVTIPSLTKSDLLQISMPLPPLDEQKRIAKNLDLASEIVKGYEEQLAELDKLVQSVFYEMFGDPVNNEKGWDISVLSNYLDIIGGYAFKSEGFSEDGIPILRIGNINSGQFKSANLVFWKKDDKLKKYMVYPGDLVISLTGTVGKEDYGNICVIGHEYNCYYLNQRNARLKLKGQLNTYYLSFLLKAPQIKGKLTGISRGVRQANISNCDILHLAVPVPPLSLQTRFASIVTDIEAQKAQIQQALTEAENLFNSLVQEYFE